MASRRELILRILYQLGWRVGGRIPRTIQRVVMRAGAVVATRHNGIHVQDLRHNLTIASGRPAAQPVDDLLVREAVESYLRNWFEMMALPAWSPSQILARVTTSGEEHLRQAFAENGAIVALPHSGNWDLAGAWACLTEMPVTTVAEELGDQEFRAFTAFREGLGMEVLANTDPAVIAKLAAAVRARRLVCLVADRDLVGSGVPVRWGTAEITMPAGPAMVARRTGASLIPAVCQFTETGMKINFGPPIQALPGRNGLTTMTQGVADFFAAVISERPVDWHLMQPFFGPSGSDR